MTEVEKYNSDSGKILILPPRWKQIHTLTQSSLKAVRSVTKTVISMAFFKRWYQIEIPIPRNGVKLNGV